MRMYGNYGNYDYGREDYGRRMRDNRGRYMGRNQRRYRGEDMIDDMRENYMTYAESSESGRGNYGHESTTMKSLEYMLDSVVNFVEMLKDEAKSPEEIELIQEYARKIGQM